MVWKRSHEMSRLVNWPQFLVHKAKCFEDILIEAHILLVTSFNLSSLPLSMCVFSTIAGSKGLSHWLNWSDNVSRRHPPLTSSHESSARLLVANTQSHLSHFRIIVAKKIKILSHVVHPLTLPLHPLSSRAELQQPLLQGVHSREAWKFALSGSFQRWNKLASWQ